MFGDIRLMPCLRSFNAITVACCATVMAIVTVSAARADDPDPRFGVYLQKPETRQAITDAVNGQVAEQSPGCTSVAIADDAKITIHSPIAFAEGAEAPNAGSWTESMTVDACGATHVHNIESIAQDGGVEVVPRLNGTTRTDIALQNDAAGYALMGASLKLKDACDDKSVVDTALVDFEGDPIANAKDGPQSRAWREEWTVQACKKEIVVPVLFTPDDTGTGISVDASGVKVKE